jgi:hypothetical protein
VREEIASATAADAMMIFQGRSVIIPRNGRKFTIRHLFLRVRGNLEVQTKPGIAMVGTRYPTPHGSGTAERLACDLAAQGLLIISISGMACGLDTARHRGAISAKGKTIAVFGTGVDAIYPKENSRPAEQILALGRTLISEFPLGSLAAAAKFFHPQPDYPRHVGGPAAVWRPRNIRAPGLPRAARWSRIATCSPSPAT